LEREAKIMGVSKVRDYLENMGFSGEIIEFDVGTETVELAAAALGTEPARICKTMSFQADEGCILIQTAGDTKISNSKFKQLFGFKAKMLPPDLVLHYTGHPVGGVCAFNIENEEVKIYSDISMKRFDVLYPAAGTGNSAIKMTPDELFKYSKSMEWIDVCNVKAPL